MDRDKKWFIMAAAILLGTAGLCGLFNYLCDPFGLFRKDFSYQYIEPNKNFVKARYIAENPDRYDSFVFGSSRVNSIDVTKIRGYRCYNMTYNGGLPGDHLLNIRYMIKKGVRIKMLLIGLDEFAFRENPAEHLSQPLRHPYPPVIGQAVLPFYLKYLFCFHGMDVSRELVKGYTRAVKRLPQGTVYDIFTHGQMSFPGVDEAIDANPENHKKTRFYDLKRTVSGDYMNGALKDIKGIVDTAKDNNIRLILFITPVYKDAFLFTGLTEFEHFKRALSTITEFYDFTGVNAVTIDTINYYEASHYRKRTGDMVLARLFGYPPVEVPSGFGVLVTHDNIEAHLRELRRQVDEEFKRKQKSNAKDGLESIRSLITQ
jgi:hypothetical protein